ncbi:50S ribosomal protein L10 [Candidatus Woesearchaeota archaeon]|nr:50S ribosomal protein L10 [Candidatus Woesearchaeota archaeon]
MANSYQTKASSVKREIIAAFAKLVEEYPIVGTVDVENLPARQLNMMREQLRQTVLIRMTKRRLLTIVLENAKKPGVKKLIPYLKGMPALIFTNESPFKLFKKLRQNKSKAPIKAGQTAPADILVPAGPTNFAPGPIIGELGSFRIKTAVENGKVAIKEDAVVAKEGDEVDAKLASILARLGIEPMEIGLNLVAVCENGQMLTKDVLDIDEEAYTQDFATAAAWALNLACNAGFPTEETVRLLLRAAHSEALALATAQDIVTDKTKEIILAKAENQAAALNKRTGS